MCNEEVRQKACVTCGKVLTFNQVFKPYYVSMFCTQGGPRKMTGEYHMLSKAPDKDVVYFDKENTQCLDIGGSK